MKTNIVANLRSVFHQPHGRTIS